MDLCLVLLFWRIGLPVCFGAVPCCFYCYSSVVVCSQVLWCFQHWMFHSELLWLLEFFCVSIFISGLTFLIPEEYYSNFDRDYVEHVDFFW
jgi:hypothetical protein